jgi:hypothetical protein
LISTVGLGAANLWLLVEDEFFKTISDAAMEVYGDKDISPSSISSARYIFMIVCCITIPFGFIMANIFLDLYFKYDKGFFSMAKLQFQFSQPNINRNNQVSGTWVDLNGQKNYFGRDDAMMNEEAQEAYYMCCLSLNQVEKDLFNAIKDSFPFYQTKKRQKMEEGKNYKSFCSKWAMVWKNGLRMLVLLGHHYVLLNYLLNYRT